jgi:hypothetical protein
MLKFFYIEKCWEIIVCVDDVDFFFNWKCREIIIVGKRWEIIAGVDVEFFYIEKYWKIIVCFNVGKWWEIISCVDDVEILCCW